MLDNIPSKKRTCLNIVALDAKIDNAAYKVYALVGDGECEEGSIWEMALFASQNKLDSFTLIVDRNNQQSFGACEKTAVDLGDLGKKFKDFGWIVFDVDGHNHEALKEALLANNKGLPKCVVAHTTKGKGVSFMENNVLWHYRDVQGEQLIQALNEIESGN